MQPSPLNICTIKLGKQGGSGKGQSRTHLSPTVSKPFFHWLRSNNDIYFTYLTYYLLIASQSTYRGRVEIKGRECICPFSWSVQYNFACNGRQSERGRACTLQPRPGWHDFTIMVECTPESGNCHSVSTYSMIVHGIIRYSLYTHCTLVGFGRVCAPMRCAHPSSWTYATPNGAMPAPPPSQLRCSPQNKIKINYFHKQNVFLQAQTRAIYFSTGLSCTPLSYTAPY